MKLYYVRSYYSLSTEIWDQKLHHSDFEILKVLTYPLTKFQVISTSTSHLEIINIHHL